MNFDEFFKDFNSKYRNLVGIKDEFDEKNPISKMSGQMEDAKQFVNQIEENFSALGMSFEKVDFLKNASVLGVRSSVGNMENISSQLNASVSGARSSVASMKNISNQFNAAGVLPSSRIVEKPQNLFEGIVNQYKEIESQMKNISGATSIFEDFGSSIKAFEDIGSSKDLQGLNNAILESYNANLRLLSNKDNLLLTDNSLSSLSKEFPKPLGIISIDYPKEYNDKINTEKLLKYSLKHLDGLRLYGDDFKKEIDDMSKVMKSELKRVEDDVTEEDDSVKEKQNKLALLIIENSYLLSTIVLSSMYILLVNGIDQQEIEKIILDSIVSSFITEMWKVFANY